MIYKNIPKRAAILTDYEARQIQKAIQYPSEIVEIEDIKSADRFAIQFGKIEKSEFIPIGFVQ